MFREVNVPSAEAKLYLHSMPGRYDTMENFISSLIKDEIDYIVCLTSDEEIQIKSPEYKDAIETGTIPCARLIFPIEDFNVPTDKSEYKKFLTDVVEKFKNQKNILIHCAGGIGRTGTFAVGFLIEYGFTKKEAFNMIEQAGSGPETDKQIKFIDEIHSFTTHRVVRNMKMEMHSQLMHLDISIMIYCNFAYFAQVNKKRRMIMSEQEKSEAFAKLTEEEKEWLDDLDSLEEAPENITGSRPFMLEAVKLDGWAIEYASEELKNDKEILMKAVQNNGNTIDEASDKLKNDRELVMEAVKTDG